MKSNVLKPEDIKPKQFITVLNNNLSFDQSFIGDVLKVKAIQFPFLIVDCFTGHGIDRYTLDTREHTFMELSDEFAYQFVPKEDRDA